MYLSISDLIENRKISYADLNAMIESGLIKNLFVGMGEGYFRKMEGTGELEDIFLQYKQAKLAEKSDSIESAKDNFKMKCHEYREIYHELKHRYWHPDGGYQIEMSREKLKEIIKNDSYQYNMRRDYLRESKRRYKNEAERIEKEKYSIMYSGIFVFEIEYNLAKDKYVKQFMYNCQEN